MNTLKKTLFIHIGKHKTGTTAIQNFLSINREELKKHSILYPGKNENHCSVAKELQKNEKSFLDQKSNTYEIFSEIVKNIDKYQKFILSSEGFSENEDRVIPRLIQTINYFKLNLQVKIIIFFRQQHTYLESAYQQEVKDEKRRMAITFEEMIKQEIQYDFLDYYSILNKWSVSFEKENIISSQYYPKQHKTKIYTDFVNILELPVDFKYLIPSRSKSNIGLTKNNIELIRWFNIFKIDDISHNQIVRILSNEYNSPQTQNTLLTSKVIDKILRQFEPSNHQVAVEYDNNPDGVLFNHPIEYPSESEIYYQQNQFDPKLFKNQLTYLIKHYSELINQVYYQIQECFDPNTEIQNPKHALITYLEQYIHNNDLRNPNIKSRKIVPYMELLDEKHKNFKLILKVSHSNFFQKTFDYSKDITNGISINGKNIQLKSIGNDPFFSINKCLIIKNTETIISIKIKPPTKTYIQLYYQTYDECFYNKNKSIIKYLNSGTSEVFFVIDNPNFNGQLRIDPGDHKGIYLIHGIKITSFETKN